MYRPTPLGRLQPKKHAFHELGKMMKPQNCLGKISIDWFKENLQGTILAHCRSSGRCWARLRSKHVAPEESTGSFQHWTLCGGAKGESWTTDLHWLVVVNHTQPWFKRVFGIRWISYQKLQYTFSKGATATYNVHIYIYIHIIVCIYHYMCMFYIYIYVRLWWW